MSSIQVRATIAVALVVLAVLTGAPAASAGVESLAGAPITAPSAAEIPTGTYLGFTASGLNAQFRIVVTRSSSGLRFRADSADYSGVTLRTTRGVVSVSGRALTFRLNNGRAVSGAYTPRVVFQGVPSRMIRLSTCSAMFSYALDRVYRCQFYRPR